MMNPEESRHVLATGRCPRCFSHITTTNMACYKCGLGQQAIWWEGRWWHPDDLPKEEVMGDGPYHSQSLTVNPGVVNVWANVHAVRANLAFPVD